MSGVQDPTNSKIVNSAWANGPGAALQYRYQDGKATNVPLLPWPMEGRGTGRTGAVNQCSGRDGTHTHDRRGGDMAGAHF